LNNTLKALLTDKLEMESIAVIVMVVSEPRKVMSNEFIVIASIKLSHAG
jgi:hypothetical protein